MAKTGGDVLVDVLPVKSGTRSERTIKGYTDTEAVGHRSGMPAREELQQAADVLNAGEKIAILAGQGALEAGDELEAIAEKLGAPIIKALLGKACVPDDSPYTTGGIGLLGTAPSQEAMEYRDTLLPVGTSFPYIEILAQALATSGPVLIETVDDPFEPLMPGKIKAKQALHLAESLARGTPDRMKIVSTVAEDKVRDLV